jgi:hypothetical protein
MADLEGQPPGLYTGQIKATRKGDDSIQEFALPVTVIVPHRVTPENQGQILLAGEVDPGFLERYFVEVPAGITSIAAEIRVVEGGGEGSRIGAEVFDPEGVSRGFLAARGQGQREGDWSLTSRTVVPGTWEFVVSSSMRSPEAASFDLVVALSGLEVGDPGLGFGDDTACRHMLVPVRCTQFAPFDGTLTGRLEGFAKKEVVVVEDTDVFTRSVRLDSSTSRASWTIDFDRETYALFTDCVLRLEDAETGETIRNSGLGQRSATVSLTVPKDQRTPKEYRLVLMPAFTKKQDTKKWRFVMTERLTWRSGAVTMEPVNPKGGRLSLRPWEWTEAEFVLSGLAPAAPAGYAVEGLLEATSRGDAGTVVRKRFLYE